MVAKEEIMTLEEVAAYLRVSERTVYDWAQKGIIPGGKLGTAWRFRRGDLERWIDERMGRSSNAAPSLNEAKTARPAASSYHDQFRQRLIPEGVAVLHCTKKNDALEQMIDTLMRTGRIDSRNELEKAVFEREELMSTGIGLQIAVPHVRLNSVKELAMAIGVSTEDIVDYESLDSQPVRIIVMIAAGKHQHSHYIKMLSSVSEALKNDVVRESILGAPTSDEIYRILTREAH